MSNRSRPGSGRGPIPARAALLALASLAACSGPSAVRRPEWTADAVRAAAGRVMADLLGDCRCGMDPGSASRVDTVEWNAGTGRIRIRLNDAFAQSAFREHHVEAIRTGFMRRADPSMPVTGIDFEALGLPIEQLVPNAYRSRIPPDPSRRPAAAPEPRPLVRRRDGPTPPERGLAGRHVALWPSHGWYYERSLDRWEWQRARLFQTVEDLLPAAFVLPYLVPMLERAGATVWLARERDVQAEMVVVDCDGSSAGSVCREVGPWDDGSEKGFAMGTPPYSDGENPFGAGTSRRAATRPGGGSSVRWEPAIPRDGAYAVHASWGRETDASGEASYTVRHAGGSTRLLVDQRMAAGTWVYLGTYEFRSGAGPDSASVTLDSSGPEGRAVSADAVRFGGGLGIVERGGRTSGRPRWMEAARYHLQYAGMPDSLVYRLSPEAGDYVDDYRGRAEWVNFLRGRGPNADRSHPGLGVPVDVSLAIHTDAGVAAGDTTIGTLAIYSSEGADASRIFPDGVSRFANRDLTDILQTRIVSDIRAASDPAWTRRPIWDRDYSEAVRPNVPSTLLEILSHQNFADMKRALDPRFRFLVSRAIYKGILQFLATQYGLPDPVVQPLAPTHLEARVAVPGRVLLRWRGASDPLEPSAEPTSFVVYTRRGRAAFDGGRVVPGDSAWIRVDPDVDYAFRVSALNDGGESAPSETVAAAWVPGAPRLLLVGAFDRLSAPASIDVGSYRGFLDAVDHGVADGLEIAFTGAQKEFDVTARWKDDDDPGHGASYGDFETRVVPGNTFDYPVLHGRSARRAGWGYDTVSDERLGAVGIEGRYAAVDVILGEERRTTPGGTPVEEFAAFPEPIVRRITELAAGGAGLFVSGSYVGTELAGLDSFARRVLHVRLRAGRAVRRGDVAAVDSAFAPAAFRFHTEPNLDRNAAESPDAIEPDGESAGTAFRYVESNMGAGIAHAGSPRTVVLGFPFETITRETDRDRLMATILRFLHEPSGTGR